MGRFALEHCERARPRGGHLTVAAAAYSGCVVLDSLDLNPFLSSAKADAPADKAKPQAAEPSPPPAAETAVPREAPSGEASPQGAEAPKDEPGGNPSAERKLAGSRSRGATARGRSARAGRGSPRGHGSSRIGARAGRLARLFRRRRQPQRPQDARGAS